MRKKPIWQSLLCAILLSVGLIVIKFQPLFAQIPTENLYLPLIIRGNDSPQSTDWHQHAADAQRTSFFAQSIPTPWRWKWAWNGPNSSGGIISGKFRLPRNSQPVVGGGRVYVAAGSHGVFALNNANGSVVWNRSDLGSVNSTPAYDPDTQALFVLSANGNLYKLNSADGSTIDSIASGSSSNLPLPPAIAANRVFFSMGNRVYALDKFSMQVAWRYDAGSAVHTPPAYSASRNLVIVATQDLQVHAIRNMDGSRAWRVKHTPLQAGIPGSSGENDYAEVSRGWPVIADAKGIVLIKLRLDWQTLWQWNPALLNNNSSMRQHLINNPDQKALLAINLDNGNEAFIANIAHGGFGDGDYMPMGPIPVIKTFPDGNQIAYVVMRGGPCKQDPCDSRWDSHLGEMMLDNQTISGLQAGDVRYMQNTFFPSDEQAYISMAGDHLFAAHWEAGIAHQIVDRSPARGSGTNPITTSNLPHIATSQDFDVCGSGFQSNHYCAQGLSNTREWPSGFYIYWQQRAVYDQYWSEYAQWVISRDTLYFVSTDGAIVALEHGNSSPASQQASQPIFVHQEGIHTPSAPQKALSPQETWQYVGQTVTVQGRLVEVFNNGKAVYLTFNHPHQGHFIVRVLKSYWQNFSPALETAYSAGQIIQVRGKLEWYQGAPVMYLTSPDQIQLIQP